MKHYIKISLRMLLTHIVVQLCALVIGVSVFMYWLTSTTWGGQLMSVVLSCFYAGFIYRRAWKMGKEDTKSYSAHKPYPIKGLIISTLTLVVTLIIAILRYAGISHHDGYSFIMGYIFGGWNFSYINLVYIPTTETVSALGWFLIFGICPFFSFLGYFAGIKNFNITDRVVYPMVYKKDKI